MLTYIGLRKKRKINNITIQDIYIALVSKYKELSNLHGRLANIESTKEDDLSSSKGEE